jgi:hypothetical protein
LGTSVWAEQRIVHACGVVVIRNFSICCQKGAVWTVEWAVLAFSLRVDGDILPHDRFLAKQRALYFLVLTITYSLADAHMRF